MRHRSRSRNYDSNDNYKSRRSPVKYESSRSHKSKVIHYSSDSRKHDSSKIKKSSDRSRYGNHRDRDSESDDKYEKKGDSNYDRDGKKSKYSKYSRGDSPVAKHSRKYDDYTHSYRRRSISSDLSNHSYDSKYKKFESKSDKKNYKSTKESKRNKISKSLSSDQLSDVKVKVESTKDKVKDKKLKKKSKKSDKDKEKKKRKRQKHSSDEDIRDNDSKRRMEEKHSTNKSSKHDDGDDQESGSKGKLKLEPFKVKESSNLKSQINFLNSSNIFTKDEWQKESSDDDLNKKSGDSSTGNPPKKTEEIKDAGVNRKVKQETQEPLEAVKPVKSENHEDSVKKLSNVKKQKSEEEKDSDKERSRKRRRRASHSKTRDSNVRSSKHREVEEDKSFSKLNHEIPVRKERSHSHNKSSDSAKPVERKEKVKSKDRKSVQKNVDEKKKVEDIFEDERIELPRTPTDAQYTGLFARLQEEPVSDTEIEDILPPILLDDRMKALLVNDPNVIQEAWDSEDDVLLNKRENIIAPKHRGVLETLAVPWKILIEEASLNKHKQKSTGLSKFTVPNLLANIGISKQLSGDLLWLDIQKHCSNAFLNPIAPIHQTLMSQKSRRNSIFCERGLFAGALSARKDLFIRRVLYEPMI